MRALLIFMLLQFADIATTLVAIALGGAESNPLVGHLMVFGTVRGLFLSKLLVLGLAAAGAYLGKHRAIRFANVVFAGVIIWNLGIIGRLALAFPR